MIVALAGGVGGAKLAQGLAAFVPPDRLSVVVNTADDFDLYGLRICPDLDTVLYTLGGIADPIQGWGIAGDTYRTLEALARYGRDPWFRLGDKDFATHIVRTERLRAGSSLTEVIAELAMALGVQAAILPMSDDPVATIVQTSHGKLAFQDYFVARRQTDDVLGVEFAGIDAASLPSGVTAAIAQAETIVFCPSNPIVSIAPILAVPGFRATLEQAAAPRIAISPIVSGRALKGPADRMLASLGHEVSPYGVASLYRGLVDGMVIDEADVASADRIESLGMRVRVTKTIMGGLDGRQRLAEEAVAFGSELALAGSARVGTVGE